MSELRNGGGKGGFIEGHIEIVELMQSQQVHFLELSLVNVLEKLDGKTLPLIHPFVLLVMNTSKGNKPKRVSKENHCLQGFILLPSVFQSSQLSSVNFFWRQFISFSFLSYSSLTRMESHSENRRRQGQLLRCQR